MSARSVKSVSAGLGVLLFLVLVAANYLSARHFFHRFDLTRNREFTVAPATRKILASLDDVVNVKVYFSENLPEQVSSIRARVRDLLAELEAYGKGKLKIETVDPQADPEVEQRVRAMGIPRVPIAVLERNRQQTVDVYLGIALLYADKKEVIPAVLDNTNLEYEVVGRILRMTRPRKKIGFLAGHGAHDSFGDYQAISEQLRQQYDLETVDLGGDKAVPEGIDTLVVAGPKQPIPERARYEIDQFLMRGGRAFFLIDAVAVDPSSLMTRPVDSGLVEQLASYGVRVQPALVSDWGMNEVVQIPSGGRPSDTPMYMIVEYPLWPKLVLDNISETHPAVNRLPSLVLPFTAPLEAVKDADDRFEVIDLLRSTEFSRAEEHLFSAHPQSLAEPRKEDLRQFLLAAAVTGPQRSFFAGKPAPPPAVKEDDVEGEDGAPVAAVDEDPPSAVASAESAARRDSTEESMIVVVGSSEFATDSMLQQRPFAPNVFFFLNTVDWLTIGDELIGIRTRLATEPMLDPARRELGEQLGPWLNILLVPGLVVGFGILWRAARKSRKVVLA